MPYLIIYSKTLITLILLQLFNKSFTLLSGCVTCAPARDKVAPAFVYGADYDWYKRTLMIFQRSKD